MNTRGLTELADRQHRVHQPRPRPGPVHDARDHGAGDHDDDRALLRFVYPDDLLARDRSAAKRAVLGADAAAYRVLVVVDPAGPSQALVDLAVDLTVDEPRPRSS